MEWNAVSALSTLATFLVVAASAIAALLQLRHIRAANQITASLALINRISTPEFQRMLQFVFHGELDRALEDPKYRAGLLKTPVDLANHPEASLLAYWEQMGSIIKLGLTSEAAFMDTTSSQCIAAWNKLAPVIALVRRVRGPQIYDNFEWLTSRSIMWEANHPEGGFLNNAPRLPLTDSLP